MSPQLVQDPHLVLWAIAAILLAVVVGKLATTHPVSFKARKKVPTQVKFETRTGEKVSFRARKSKIVPVKFRAKNK